MEFNKTNRGGHHISGQHINTVLTEACEYGVVGTGERYTTSSRGEKWEVMYDGTAGAGGGMGWEVSSPAMEMDEDGECAELERGCNTLMRDLAPKISSNCGLHVHVDVSDFNWREVQKLLGLWTRYEPFFFSMVPAFRARSSYCHNMRAATWREAYRSDQSMSYAARVALEATTERNFTAACRSLGKFRTVRMDMWPNNGRVEFRLHSSTINYGKIRQWVRLLLSLVGRVKTSTMGTTGRLPVRVRPLSRATGFGPSYVLGALGMGPNGGVGTSDATMEIYESLMQWIPERQRKFSRARSNR
jgi:hypothetical protein